MSPSRKIDLILVHEPDDETRERAEWLVRTLREAVLDEREACAEVCAARARVVAAEVSVEVLAGNEPKEMAWRSALAELNGMEAAIRERKP